MLNTSKNSISSLTPKGINDSKYSDSFKAHIQNTHLDLK